MGQWRARRRSLKVWTAPLRSRAEGDGQRGLQQRDELDLSHKSLKHVKLVNLPCKRLAFVIQLNHVDGAGFAGARSLETACKTAEVRVWPYTSTVPGPGQGVAVPASPCRSLSSGKPPL